MPHKPTSLQWINGHPNPENEETKRRYLNRATKSMIADPFPVLTENLRNLPVGNIFLYETNAKFSTIAADAFARRIPGCSVVICQCADQTRTVILDLNARIEKTY